MVRTIALALAFAAGLTAAAGAQTLQVGAYPANPPWEQKQPDGSMEGLEVDLVREIARRMDRGIQIQDLGFQALFAAVSSGRVDMAISTISITDDRLENQSFTQPYYDTDLALVTSEGSSVTGLADLEGKPVGALSTSTGETWIKANAERYGFGGYKGYDTFQNLLLDIANGRVAGGVSDIGGLQYAMQRMPAIQMVETIPTGEKFAIMMAKGSPLLEQVNDAISAIKEDGTMAKLHEQYLGVALAPGSSTVTVMPVPTAQ